MSKEEIKKAILKNIQNSKFKDDIKSVSLFGSCLYNKETENSDVDILISFNPQATVGFFKLAKIKRSLEDSIKRDVDLVTPETLSQYFKQDVINDVEQIYAQ